MTAGCSPRPLAERRANEADGDAANWLLHGRTHFEQRFSPLDQINTESVLDLGLAWVFDFDTRRGQEATPLVVDGVMYVTSSWSKVYAIDARTGEQLWKHDPQVPARTAVRVG